MSTIKSALFFVCLLLVPAAASAQNLPLHCRLLPSLCERGDEEAKSVPELDANAAGTAGALVLGAALLMTSRRRRIA
jgi:hypothetical protein